jgi:hypothetical protein
MKKTSLRQQLEAFDKGIYLDNSGAESWCFNFYDWFCKDESLKRKADTLFKQVKKFVGANPSIDIDKHYVFFKNNCPANGPLYDDFRICDIQEGDVQYNVTAKSGHSGQAEVYCRSNGFKEPVRTGKTFTDLIRTKL